MGMLNSFVIVNAVVCMVLLSSSNIASAVAATNRDSNAIHSKGNQLSSSSASPPLSSALDIHFPDASQKKFDLSEYLSEDTAVVQKNNGISLDGEKLLLKQPNFDLSEYLENDVGVQKHAERSLEGEQLLLLKQPNFDLTEYLNDGKKMSKNSENSLDKENILKQIDLDVTDYLNDGTGELVEPATSFEEPQQIPETRGKVKSSGNWRKKVRGSGKKTPRNYLASDVMTDGEHEFRLHFTGVSGKQTYVGPTEGSPGGLVVRQVSNGRQLLYLIYNGVVTDTNSTTRGRADHPQYDAHLYHVVDTLDPEEKLTLKDCSLDTNRERVDAFVKEFLEESQEAQWQSEGSLVRAGVDSNSWNEVRFERVRSLSHLPKIFRPLAHFRSLKRHCRRHQKVVKAEVRARTQHGGHQHDMQKVDHVEAAPSHPRSRNRRSISDLFILPGTLWCGSQNRASSSLELSGHLEADACCRLHDYCPYNIDALSTKHGLFNTNFFTMSHCGCDIRFRTCLKLSNTGAANLVGRVFFDMVRTECFVFVKQKVCLNRNWWGQCQRYGIERRAVMREPAPWTL